MESSLFELGAESLSDPGVDTMAFMLESEYQIQFPRTDLFERASEHLDADDLVVNGVITDLGLELLRKGMPELDPARIKPGLRDLDVAQMITVDSFTRITLRLLAAKAEFPRQCPTCGGQLEESDVMPEFECAACGETVPLPKRRRLPAGGPVAGLPGGARRAMRFLLVDSIVELEPGSRAVGIKNVTMSEDFLADHFPDRPIMPGMLIVESLVQLADWVVRQASGFTCLGVARGFDNVKFRHIVRPGDQLRLVARRVDEVENLDDEVTFQGRAYLDDTLVASVTMTLARLPLEDYLDPDEARRAFRLLCPAFSLDTASLDTASLDTATLDTAP